MVHADRRRHGKVCQEDPTKYTNVYILYQESTNPCRSACPSVSVCLPVCLPVYLSICLLVCLIVCLPACLLVCSSFSLYEHLYLRCYKG